MSLHSGRFTDKSFTDALLLNKQQPGLKPAQISITSSNTGRCQTFWLAETKVLWTKLITNWKVWSSTAVYVEGYTMKDWCWTNSSTLVGHQHNMAAPYTPSLFHIFHRMGIDVGAGDASYKRNIVNRCTLTCCYPNHQKCLICSAVYYFHKKRFFFQLLKKIVIRQLKL